MGYRAIQEGAAEVNKRRNIFQGDDPMAMICAVRAIVHEALKPPRPNIGSCPGPSERL
jgi:3-hydroxy-5-phosphonooxypentane-2,4-dione thiolase